MKELLDLVFDWADCADGSDWQIVNLSGKRKQHNSKLLPTRYHPLSKTLQTFNYIARHHSYKEVTNWHFNRRLPVRDKYSEEDTQKLTHLNIPTRRALDVPIAVFHGGPSNIWYDAREQLDKMNETRGQCALQTSRPVSQRRSFLFTLNVLRISKSFLSCLFIGKTRRFWVA